MIISYRHGFIFLKTQKTAGTSVEIALSSIAGPEDVLTPLPAEDESIRAQSGRGAQNTEVPPEYRPWWAALAKALSIHQARGATRYYNHMPARSVRARMDPAKFDRFRKLTIVRNPWDREVSLYYWRYKKAEKLPPFEDFVRRRLILPERKTFEIYSIDGQIVATDVIRYETLAADFKSFVTSLGVENAPELPNAKGAFRPKGTRDYRDMYNDATRDVIARRYRREIETFGYTF